MPVTTQQIQIIVNDFNNLLDDIETMLPADAKHKIDFPLMLLKAAEATTISILQQMQKRGQ